MKIWISIIKDASLGIYGLLFTLGQLFNILQKEISIQQPTIMSYKAGSKQSHLKKKNVDLTQWSLFEQFVGLCIKKILSNLPILIWLVM